MKLCRIYIFLATCQLTATSVFAEQATSKYSDYYDTTASETARSAAIADFFSPPPTNEVGFSTRDLNRGVSLQDIRGFVNINVAQDFFDTHNDCLLVDRGFRYMEELICPRDGGVTLSFQVQDLDVHGRITWLVSSQKQNTFRIPMHWQTSARIGFQVPVRIGSGDNNREMLLMKECSAEVVNDEDIFARIKIEFFDMEPLMVSIPTQELFLEGFREGQPNLVVLRKHENLQMKFRDIHGRLIEDKGDSVFFEIEQEIPEKIAAELKKPWVINRKFYILDGSKTSWTTGLAGGSGFCKYRYEGIKRTADSGAFECKNVGDFKWIFLPLPCLTDLR